MLTKTQQERYERQLLIEGFSEEEQTKLFQSSVLVIGAGGLGAPVLQYLCAAGVGRIGIVDFDVIALSNLQRQVLFTNSDIGKPKAELARDRLLALNPECIIELYPERWDVNSSNRIGSKYDLIVDCSDNLEARIATDKITKRLEIPFVFGAIDGWDGQISVFNYRNAKSFCESFGLSPDDDITKKGPIGVIGVAPSVIGSLQASEAIKIIINAQDILTGKMLHVSLKNNSWNTFNF